MPARKKSPATPEIGKNVPVVKESKTAADSVKKKFSAHLKKIEKAKSDAEKIAAEFSANLPKAALAKAWEATFDLLCAAQTPLLSASDLNTLAGVIQKLSAVKCSLPDSSPSSQSDDGAIISDSALKAIEEKLKLL